MINVVSVEVVDGIYIITAHDDKVNKLGPLKYYGRLGKWENLHFPPNAETRQKLNKLVSALQDSGALRPQWLQEMDLDLSGQRTT